MNERIKELRKSLGLTMEKFGERLGVTKVAISNIEKGNRNVTDQMFKFICREFNVNENWLRTGEGSMFNNTDTFSLDDYAKQYNVSELELEIIKAYFELDADVRKSIISHFREKLSSNSSTVRDDDKTVEELEEEYKKSRLNSVRKTGSSALSTNDDTEVKAGNE